MKKFLTALLTLLVIVSLLSAALASTVRTTGNVWLRKGPGKGYGKIRAVSSGTKLEYLGKTSTDSRGVKWYYVKHKGTKCWVSSRYSKLSGSSSSSSSKKSTTKKSSTKNSTATKAPSATPTPVPEPVEEPIVADVLEPIADGNAADTAASGEAGVPTFGDPEPVELSNWYLAKLEEAAAALSLGQHQHDVTAEWPNAYFNEVLLISGDDTTEYFHITGEGYAVYGVSVGMDMETAVNTLVAAGLSRDEGALIGASFKHYAGADAPVNVQGFDSFINLIADASGKVSEISWSVYTGDWTQLTD